MTVAAISSDVHWEGGESEVESGQSSSGRECEERGQLQLPPVGDSSPPAGLQAEAVGGEREVRGETQSHRPPPGCDGGAEHHPDCHMFSDPVNMSRFFYMDNILLSASGNKLAVHSLKLPDSQGDACQYKLRKLFSMKNCKTVTSLSCVNQFFSFLTS